MNYRRAVSVLLAVTAATMLVTGSFGFTSVSADRGVSVAVVDDSQAYLNYQTGDRTVQDGESAELVRIGNLLGSEIQLVDVSIDDGSFTIDDVSGFETIAPGDNGAISGTVHCEAGEVQEVAVTVTIDGNGVSAQIDGNSETRRFTLTCAESAATIDGVEFKGAGNVDAAATNVGTTEIVYWTTDKKWKSGNAQFDKHSRSFNTNDTLQPQLNGNTRIVAIYFPEYDVTFIHPNYYDGNWGTGDGDRVPGEHDPASGPP